MDGNRVPDTISGYGYSISSLQGSGLHRNPSELADKDAFRQQVLGGSLYWNNGRWKFSWNGIAYWFSHALEQGREPYQRNNITGKKWMNHSVGYGGTIRNMYVFGEIAQAASRSIGLIQGMMISIDPRMDLAFVFRHLPPGYRALQANAFTEQGNPGNESGLYTAVSLRPSPAWRLDAWLDVYRIPWLRYRVHSPSAGREIQVSLAWKPNKLFEMLQRLQAGQKDLNLSDDRAFLRVPMPRRQIQYRIQVSFQPNRFIQIRQRLDFCQVSHGGLPHRGTLISADLTARLPKHPIALSTRVSWFQADSYEARLYQFERDVLYSYAISPFYRQGVRMYCMVESRLGGGWKAWLKCSTTLFNDNQLLASSGEDPLPMQKLAIRFQVMRIF
jgi:hypothetical protein